MLAGALLELLPDEGGGAGRSEVADDLQREGHRGWGWNWRYATPMGAMRYIQRQKQRSDEEQEQEYER